MEQFLLELVYGFGYLGVFVMGVLSSATLFLPTPAFAIVFMLAAPQFGFNPFLLGLVAGAGAAVGEMSGYVIGYGSKKLLLKKYKKQLDGIRKSFEKYSPPVVIFVFAATPLPFDIVGLLCGIINYSWKNFFLATLAGKLVKYFAIAYAGYYGIGWISKMFGL